MITRYVLGGLALAGLSQPAGAYDVKARLDLEPLIVKHAAANNVPAPLVHRIILRESRYNPRAVGRGGAMGLMQIKYGTARALGYAGPPAGLLDADTNLTYAVRYLAGAYRVAGGDQNRAVGFYARGYYYDAKRKGLLGVLAKRPAAIEEAAAMTAEAAVPQPAPQPSIFSLMFAPQPAAPAPEAVQAAAEEPAAVPAPARRSGASAKRRGGAAAASTTTAPVQAEGAPQAAPVVATEAGPPVADKRRNHPAARKTATSTSAADAAQAAAQPVAEGVEAQAPVRRSRRSAAQPGAADAGRSAQRASEPPADPGRRP